MANAFKELKGTRRIEDQLTHVDYVIAFQGTTGSDVPIIVGSDSLYTHVVGSGSLSSTNLVGEPEIVQVSHLKRVTPLKNQCTIRFRGYYTDAV